MRLTLWSVWVITPQCSDGKLYCKKHHPSDETLNGGPDSLWSLTIPGCPLKKSRGVTRCPGQIHPLASDHHGLLIIPISTDWLHHSVSSKLVCGGRSGTIWLSSHHHPGGCCTLVLDEKTPPPLYVKSFECPEKFYIYVRNYYYHHIL